MADMLIVMTMMVIAVVMVVTVAVVSFVFKVLVANLQTASKPS
jgi:hypothetical protein